MSWSPVVWKPKTDEWEGEWKILAKTKSACQCQLENTSTITSHASHGWMMPNHDDHDWQGPLKLVVIPFRKMHRFLSGWRFRPPTWVISIRTPDSAYQNRYFLNLFSSKMPNFRSAGSLKLLYACLWHIRNENDTFKARECKKEFCIKFQWFWSCSSSSESSAGLFFPVRAFKTWKTFLPLSS